MVWYLSFLIPRTLYESLTAKMVSMTWLSTWDSWSLPFCCLNIHSWHSIQNSRIRMNIARTSYLNSKGLTKEAVFLSLCSLTMKKKSPVYPKNETNDYNGDEYDPHAEFSQFLEEAKRNENFEFEVPCSNPEVAGNRKQDQVKKKKKKKAWKVFLLPWLKGEKKSKSHMEPATNSRVPNTKRGFASGPIYSCGEALDGKHRRPKSGPIASLFNPSRRADTELPYMCLNQLGSPPAAQSYGPVYKVPKHTNITR